MNLKVRVFLLAALLCAGLSLQNAVAQPGSSRKPTGGEMGAAFTPTGAPEWIWSPLYTHNNAPAGACFFRKQFTLSDDVEAKIDVACDNRYELYVNGKRIGAGANWNLFNTYDISSTLKPGVNVIAIKASNEELGAAGLIARLSIKEGDRSRVIVTDDTWRTQLQYLDGWETIDFDDSSWKNAASHGPLGTVEPWGTQLALPGAERIDRFKHSPEFSVHRVISPEDTGSVIAFTFNEWGEAIISKEGGGLLLAADADSDGNLDTVTTYCDEIKNCQGLLALNGLVYAVGEGAEGPGLYLLADNDHDGVIDELQKLVGFKGAMSEHGPHAVRLGPDGYLYVMIGNHSSLDGEPAEDSPHHHYYEGDLIQPKYEDAGGHAVGVKAPGGCVLRMTTDGREVQLFAGGLRNAYDMAFNRQGELFTVDSDMEWDAETPWYRPTRVNHVTAGAEFGWRSGWSKWPDYYIDSLPPTLDLGRGSPTGVEVYDHYKYPIRYQNALFACDWAQGQILAIKLVPSAGSYKAHREVFLEGQPLNATDVAVGPDGWLYFSTGGRGTEGGLYRIEWNGKIPPIPQQSGIGEAIRTPQLSAAFSRQKIALLQQRMGDQWDAQIKGAVLNPRNTPADRARALDLMQLFGPLPEPEMLIELSGDSVIDVRAKATCLLGLQADAACGERLVSLLADPSPTVRRMACESLVRGKFKAPPSAVMELLAEPNPYVACAARRLLQTMPRETWQTDVLSSKNQRVFLQGAVALLALDPPQETCQEIIRRGQEMLQGFVSDTDFIDLMRVFQLAIIKGDFAPQDLALLRRQLAEEYPSGEHRMNRELVRLLVWLQASEVLPRLVDELAGDADPVEKLHAALHARFFNEGWTGDQKFAILEYYNQARSTPGGGHSLVGYIDNITRDFVKDLRGPEKERILNEGEKWPVAALSVLATLDDVTNPARVDQLIALDQRLAGTEDAEAKKLRVGIVAVLGVGKQPRAMEYLREQFENDPERRSDLAMGLAQAPDGENYPYLIRALPILEGVAAQEILSQLARADRVPDDAEAYRQVILCGLRLRENNGLLAVKVLEKWTGETLTLGDEGWEPALAAWQNWFAEAYPDSTPAELPKAAANAKYNVSELLTYIESSPGQSNRGMAVYDKAQCSKCHQFRGRGEGMGPDLSTVGKRFQKKEILQSIIFPSHTISDQYASKTIVTTDGLTYTGIVGSAGADAIVVLQASGEKIRIPNDEVAETLPSTTSAMPDGLLDKLTLDEIADLMAYLTSDHIETAQRPSQPAEIVAPRGRVAPRPAIAPARGRARVPAVGAAPSRGPR